jgi:Asp-tRNA(Asn)/Glu-tRNA(Gln) amidotransferase B subunit
VEIRYYCANQTRFLFCLSASTASNFVKGQVMRLSKGKANPALAGEILERKFKA